MRVIITMSATINNMRYLVRAISLFGGIEEYEFNTKEEALVKVRELKDIGGYIIKPVFEIPSKEKLLK